MDKRIVCQLNEDESKKIINFKDIKKGMFIELFEPDSKQVVDSENNKIFIAKSDAYLNVNNIYSFEYVPKE